MAKELISRRTRREFREWLVGWTLRTIADLFDDEGIPHTSLPEEQLPSGMRRSLVEEYYASVDWTNPVDVRKILNVYEHILRTIPDENEYEKVLIQCLERDGYQVSDNRIIARSLQENLAEVIRATDKVSLEHLQSYIERIRFSIDTDPELAVGSTKELLEATLKTILRARNIPFGTNDDIPKLLKKVQRELDLDPSEVDESKRGAQIIKKVLGAAGTMVVGIAELRNLYGSGHGRAKVRGITPRHARLVVGVGTTLSSFLLETFEKKV